jgi:hypothetical protein
MKFIFACLVHMSADNPTSQPSIPPVYACLIIGTNEVRIESLLKMADKDK